MSSDIDRFLQLSWLEKSVHYLKFQIKPTPVPDYLAHNTYQHDHARRRRREKQCLFPVITVQLY